MKILKHLEALEIKYVEMTGKISCDGWGDLLSFTFEAKEADILQEDWSILEVRQRFSEKSRDLVIVSTLTS